MIRIRAVRLEARTDGTAAGFELVLQPGLVIVSGPNSVGKTLLFHSIVYGLGLEGMYGPGRQHGLLTRAMTDSVTLPDGEHTVRSSAITIEIENDEGRILSAQRAVAGDIDSQLVAVWEGPILTGGSEPLQRRDYFVRRSGAASSGAGFHRLLAEFLGWDLPSVPTFNGTETTLYLELVFSLFIIEQKAGWAGALPRVPTYLQIRDPLQRVVEFVLRLDILHRARERQRLQGREADARTQFESIVAGAKAVANARGARLAVGPGWQEFRRLALSTSRQEVELSAEALDNSEWLPIEAVIQRRAGVDTDLAVPAASPMARPTETQLGQRLREAVQRLRDLAGQLNGVEETIDMIHSQLGSLVTRIQTVDEERRRYEELKTLVSLGSPVAVATFAHRDCPTCLRSLTGLEHQPDLRALDYDQSLRLLTEQSKSLRALEADAQRSVEQQVLVRQSLESQAEQVRRQIRAIRADLVTPDSSPSIADLEERLRRQAESDSLRTLRTDLETQSAVLTELAGDLRETLNLLAAMGPDELTPEEEGTLRAWATELREELSLLGASTFPVDQLEMPPSGKPTIDGYDVGFQSSASDIIRLRWAYALSLLRTSVLREGRHAGLVMMDEPRQQEVESLSELLALASGSGGQVILTTSEPVDSITAMLAQADATAQVVRIEGSLLRPID